jgi:hypothetical protein
MKEDFGRRNKTALSAARSPRRRLQRSDFFIRRLHLHRKYLVSSWICFGLLCYLLISEAGPVSSSCPWVILWVLISKRVPPYSGLVCCLVVASEVPSSLVIFCLGLELW